MSGSLFVTENFKTFVVAGKEPDMPSKIEAFCVFCFFLFVSLFVGLHASYSEEAGKNYWPTKQWKVSSPEKLSVDSKKLEEMKKYILEKCPNAASILLVRNGYIVF
jgi:hypothetical protein